MQERIFVYAALASWRGVKDAPKSAKDGMLSYNEAGLHDARRNDMVAWPVGKGKRKAIVVAKSRGQRYGSWGRTSACVANMVQRAIDPASDGVAIVLPYGVAPHDKAPDWQDTARRCMLGNKVAEAYAIARAIKMPASKLPKPVYAAPSTWGRHESNVQAAIDGLDPVKVKAKRARLAKERRYDQAMRQFNYEVARAVNQDPEYLAATAACPRVRVPVENIARYLNLPLNTYIKFVYATGQGTQQTYHTYTQDELSGQAATPYVEPAICSSGYHFTDIQSWYSWAKGDCYRVTPATPIAGSQGDKHVAGSIWFTERLGSAAEIQAAAMAMAGKGWNVARYGADAWKARRNIEMEYREFMLAPKRSNFGLED